MKQPKNNDNEYAPYAVPLMSISELATARAAMKTFIGVWYRTRKYGQPRDIIREAINIYRKLCNGRIA
jgi:hypothetical protein